jgi:hypothetical protein
MQKVSVQALNECFNVSGPDYVEMPEDWEKMYDDCTFELQSRAGKIGGKIGGPKGARTQMENKIGMWSRSGEERRLDNVKGGKIAGNKHKENGTGIFSLTDEEKLENCKKGGQIMGKRTMELGIGIHSLTTEDRVENGKKYGHIGGRVVAEKYSRTFSLISPDGEVVEIKNLTKFCRENNLTRANIQSVLRGNRNHHKGWKQVQVSSN